MKRKNLVKIFTVTLCLSFVFSTIAMAKDYKEIKQYKSTKISRCAVAPLPTEDNFPD